MTRFAKKLLTVTVVPLLRLTWPVVELSQRLRAFLVLAARLPTRLDTSVVVMGPPSVLGTRNIRLGRNLLLYPDLTLETRELGTIEIGDDVVISRGVHIVAFAGISIGAGSMIGEYTSIRDANHRRDENGEVRETGHDSKPIFIGKRVWIGRGAMILPGVCIGDGATVGANAVVTRDVSAGVAVAGVPAKLITRRSVEQEARP